jgi:pimeloyl-ACP methyl ester carboxylesterase
MAILSGLERVLGRRLRLARARLTSAERVSETTSAGAATRPSRGPASRLLPPTNYYGGKAPLAPWTASLLPPHRTCVGPFGGSRVLLAGHSEGGHAALWAAELAPSCAPELQVGGAAALAPGADLPTLVRLAGSRPAGLASAATYLVVAWSDTYHLPPRPCLCCCPPAAPRSPGSAQAAWTSWRPARRWRRCAPPTCCGGSVAGAAGAQHPRAPGHPGPAAAGPGHRRRAGRAVPAGCLANRPKLTPRRAIKWIRSVIC